MKKVILLAVFALISTASFSQVTYRVMGGLNFSNFTNSGDELSTRVGYHIGGGIDYPITEMLSLQTGLQLTAKGANFKDTDFTMNAIYLQVPIYAAARFVVSEKLNVVLNAGPYLAYGIAGKTSTSVDVERTSVEVSFDTFQKDMLKKFDMGLGFGVGFEVSQFLINLGGEYGLTNVQDMSNADNSKTINFSVGVGYRF